MGKNLSLVNSTLPLAGTGYNLYCFPEGNPAFTLASE